MLRSLLTIAILLFFCETNRAQSYGLTFSSHEVVQEKRTSMDLSPGDSLCFSQNFDLDFDFRFVPGYTTYFGYILRIISGENRNIDLIFNQKGRTFLLVTDENFAGSGFTIDSVRSIKEWNRFSLRCNLAAHSLELYVNGKIAVHTRSMPPGHCFKFLWGANDYSKFKTRDIPPMQVRDIRIFEKSRLKYYWPLDETTGTVCNDKENSRQGAITNPMWIKPRHQQWQHSASFVLGGYASCAFDSRHDKLLITGSDSLVSYSSRATDKVMTTDANPHHEFILGHQAVYDTLTDRLYDVFIDEKKLYPYNAATKRWADQPFHFVTEYWHANKLISSKDSSVYIFGGYGQLRYKNMVQRYSIPTQRWDSLKTSGDFFAPRYLAGLGTDPNGRYAYILGGYGSVSGDQMLDPFNNYDFFQFDMEKRSFKKLFTIHPKGGQFTFANSLVIPKGSGDYYALTFPNDSFKSGLQLIKGSLKDSSYQLMATQIPFSFHDIRSFADLYYSRSTNQLIAVTLLYTKEDDKAKSTEVNIYTLDFPPELLPAGEQYQYVFRSYKIWIWLGLLIASALAVWGLLRRKGKGKVVLLTSHAARKGVAPPPGVLTRALPAGDTEPTVPEAHASSLSMITNRYPGIYLFGQFQVIDKEGHDISRLFTPLLKELFLIILINSVRNKRGISSEGLTELLWHDKSPKDAMNNRSVNITKLKSVLEKVGHCAITKDSGSWTFEVQHDGVYVDYIHFEQMAEASAGRQVPIRNLLDIIRRGSLLSQTDYNWLDNVKSEVSNKAIELGLSYLKTHDSGADPDLVLNITNCIFYFDPLNEEALGYKCKTLINLKRHSLAKTTYLNFTKDFRNSYGEEFGESFSEVIAHQPY